jgi:nucleotide sugar dehydrogenase
MKISVIGLGKIGLPIAVQYARMGHDVIGVDTNPDVVSQVNSAFEPFPDEEDLEKYLKEVIGSKRLKAVDSYTPSLKNVDVFVVAVPVKLNALKEADFSIIDEVSKALAPYISRGSLICFETTLPVGITRNRLTPILEKYSGLKASMDFHVAFSPERVFTGRVFKDLRRYPKIVGGLSDECAKKAKAFYESVLEFDVRNDLVKPNGVWLVKNAETAELTKLAETTYRDVNIALANQYSTYADSVGINIYEVIEAANSQPFSHIHQPGISVGGHCIPIYPHFYLTGDPSAGIVREARQVNLNNASYAVRVLSSNAGGLENKSVLILGVSYRANVKEASYSGAFLLRDELSKQGAHASFIDPYFTSQELLALGLDPFSGDHSAIDAVILHTAHSTFKTFLDSKFSNCKFVLDGRNFLTKEDVVGQLITPGNL